MKNRKEQQEINNWFNEQIFKTIDKRIKTLDFLIS